MLKYKEDYELSEICKEYLCDGVNGQIPLRETTENRKLLSVVDQIFLTYFAESILEKRNSNTIQAACNPVTLQSLKVSSNQMGIPHAPNNDDIWIFGYGSLVWKADFPFIDRKPGFIRGYQRRFYQNSIDHRGTPEKPGRVVTLLPTERSEDRVYGVAYRIPVKEREIVLAHLDYREKNGYERCTLEFQEYPEETGEHFNVIMYVATSDNGSFAGNVWQLHKIAEQIVTSTGPSGSNREYLFNLANSMRLLFPGVNDKHLFDLEQEVWRTIQEEKLSKLEQALKKDILNILVKALNEENQHKSNINDLLEEFQKLREKFYKKS